MPVEIILNQILILAIVAVTGVIASWCKVINEVTKDFIAQIIFNVTLPSMLLTNFSRLDLTPRLLSNSLQFLILAVIVHFFMLFTGWFTSKIMRMKSEDSAIFKIHSMMGNVIYLGFPVIYSIYGQEGLLYASLFTIVSNVLMWTVGVMIITNNKKIPASEQLKHILNPNTIAIILGFILFLLNIKLPRLILESIGGLGSTNTYLSMIYIGALLWYARVGALLKNKNIYILSFNRLILVPLILTGLFFVAVNTGVINPDKMVLSVLILESAMPCMVNVVIIVKILGIDNTPAVANVFLTTLLSILTLPLILICLRLIQ